MKAFKKRIPWIDVVKGWSSLLIIAYHFQIEFLRFIVTTFHLPIFFFMAGYVFNESYEWKVFFKKKIKALVIPYFVLGLIIVAFKFIYPINPDRYTWDQFLDLLMKLVIQNRTWTIWFLPALFGANLLFYLIVKCYKNEFERAIIIVLLTVSILSYYRVGGKSVFWNLDTSVVAIPFMYGGYLLKKRQKQLTFLKHKNILLMLFSLSCVIFSGISYLVSGRNLSMHGNIYGYEPAAFMASFAGIMSIILFSQLRQPKAIEYIGRNNLIYFGLHSMIFMPLVSDFLIWTNWFPHRGTDVWERRWFLLVEFILVLICLTIVTRIIDKGKSYLYKRKAKSVL